MSFSPILWTYHSGFPKASDTSKMIDKRGVDLGDKYEGSKLGFQPKPAVEHIIIGMKPHGSKSYIDNVLNFEALPDNIKMTYPFIQVPKPAKKEKQLGSNLKVSHPTIKPVKLMSYIITLFTREGDFVLDPFLGSGTTGIASKLMGRSFVGIEREQEYMDIAQERCGIDRPELIKFFKK
jgi:DNA modification methylase